MSNDEQGAVQHLMLRLRRKHNVSYVWLGIAKHAEHGLQWRCIVCGTGAMPTQTFIDTDPLLVLEKAHRDFKPWRALP
jgi:hypothetical protein